LLLRSGNVGESGARTRVAAQNNTLNLVLILIIIIHIVVLLNILILILIIIIVIDDMGNQLAVGVIRTVDLRNGGLEPLHGGNGGFVDDRLATDDLVDLGASHGDALGRGGSRHGGVRLGVGAAAAACGASRV
jgi:hypothetical protein